MPNAWCSAKDAPDYMYIALPEFPINEELKQIAERKCSTFNNKIGYTNGMKTAISIPDNIFKEAEKFARKSKKSRSQLYVEAITEYLERHAPDTITDAMNDVSDKLGTIDNTFAIKAAKKILNQEQW